MKYRWLVLLLMFFGLSQIAQATYLYAKAQLAQALMQRAWISGLNGEPSPPWPWADTYPIARLRVPELHIDQIVLAGASGRNLAFGPGFLLASFPPDKLGGTVLAGHRDTHFRFLEDVTEEMELQLQWIDGHDRNYRVIATGVVDSRFEELDLDASEGLTLVTCYPFDAIDPGGPLRYMVNAEPVTL